MSGGLDAGCETKMSGGAEDIWAWSSRDEVRRCLCQQRRSRTEKDERMSRGLDRQGDVLRLRVAGRRSQRGTADAGADPLVTATRRGTRDRVES